MASTTDYVSAGTGSGIYIGQESTTGNVYSLIQASTNGNNGSGVLSLNKYGGNIGIGTTTPGTQLSIAGSSQAVATSWNDAGPTGATLTLQELTGTSNANKGGAILFAANQGNFAFIQGGITGSNGPSGVLNFGTRAA